MESTQEHKSQGNVFHPGWIVIGLLAITTIWMSYPFWLAEFLRLIQWTGQDHVAATGQFGDSFGALNTLFSGMAFAVLVVTLLLQQQEMRAQRVEFRKNQDIAERQETALRRQTFEATLFQWLGLHHQLVDRINFEVVRHHYRSREGFQSEVNEFYGRNALDRMWNDNIVHEFVRRIAGMGKQKKQVADLTTAVHDILEKNAPSSVTAHAFNKSLDAASREDLVLVVQMFQEVYKDTYSEHEHQFDHYIRSIFRLFRWILLSEWPADLKREYIGIVRAQLSWVELAFLLLNCLTPAGHKMRRVAEITALFDNYGRTDDPIYRVIRSSGSIEQSAFQTNLARNQHDNLIDGANVSVSTIFSEQSH